ncbi:MAG: hypothetical protein M0P99_01580 [Candidatus Cloacimonetes bacterium]|nr:hypothetical protein [Candidatus Cloacimonadota bacterium]
MRDVLIILLALVLLGGCDLFKVRESEPPGEPPPWNDYAYDLEYALENLSYCYTDSRNKIHYAAMFTDAFVFHFASQDISDFSMPTIWNRSQEQNMIELLHNHYAKIEMDTLKIDGDDQISENEAIIYSPYTIRVTLRNSIGQDVIDVRGNLELHFRRISGYWYIDKWYDYRGRNDIITWGKLKYDNS